MKRRQFEFLNDPNFVVLSQSEGNQQLFPATGQLAKLWRAINQDFIWPLPPKIRQADHRAKDSVKYLRHSTATGYCALFNAAREDRINLHPLPDTNLVTQITIVQRITTKCPKGDVHYFKFYGGTDFFPEIRLNGKRIQITSHVLDRFEERFPGNPGEALSNLVSVLFAHPWMTAIINGSIVMVTPYEDTIFAFPFEEIVSEFLLKTCLTVNEIHSFELGPSTNIYYHHYAQHFSPPSVRQWNPEQELNHCRQIWDDRIPMQSDVEPLEKNETWFGKSYSVTDSVEQQGFKADSKFVFLDDLPGPVVHLLKPLQ
jgi:hypothetical protein